MFFNQCIFLARPVLDPGHAECVCKRCSNESKPSCPWFFHVYCFKGSLLASHGFQFYWLQRPLWLPMPCQAVVPPHQYHNAAIPISKQGTIP